MATSVQPVDEAGDATAARELLDRADPPASSDVQDSRIVKNGEQLSERDRAIALVKEWKLDKEGKSIERIERLARISKRSILDETKYQISLIKNTRRARGKRGAPAIPAEPPSGHGVPSDEPAAGKATGKGFRSVRSVQSLQNLLAAEKRERATEREAAAERDRELTARLARLEVQDLKQSSDDLTEGLAGVLVFIFDSVSEYKRATFATRARKIGRDLDGDEAAAASAWLLDKKKAEAIARPFATVLARHMGEDWIEMLPLLVGICGLGAHITNGIRADRLADAERLTFTPARA